MALAGIIIAGVVIAALLGLIMASGIRVIRPYENGLYIFLGKYKGKLQPGLNYVIPFASTVHRVDLRTQTWDVPRQEVITRDNSPTNVDAVIYARVVDPVKAVFEVSHYIQATVALAQTTLRSVIGEMDLDETLNSRERINTTLRDTLDDATEAWGIKVESVEIREVDPVRRVKEAMERQTSAERERRAAILEAEGKKRAAILEAEGDRESQVLRAQGEAQASILRAEGQKTAEILQRQGEARGLQTLAAGAAALGPESLAVLGFNTLRDMSDGASTKFVLPMELSMLARSASQALGSGDGVSFDATTKKRLSDFLGPDWAELLEGGAAVEVLAEAKRTAELASAKADKDAAIASGAKVA